MIVYDVTILVNFPQKSAYACGAKHLDKEHRRRTPYPTAPCCVNTGCF
jgi:hypothetical protein